MKMQVFLIIFWNIVDEIYKKIKYIAYMVCVSNEKSGSGSEAWTYF